MDRETRIFKLTPNDLQMKLQPTLQEQSFLIADSGDLTLDHAMSILQGCEDVALELIPECIFKLTQSISEVCVEHATENQTEIKLSITPIVSCEIYVNLSIKRTWDSRRAADALGEAEYTLDKENGVIRLVKPLAEGDKVYAHYTHSACSGWQSVKQDILALCASEVASRFELFDSANTDFGKLADTARYNLKDRKRIANIPRLKWIENSPFDSDNFSYLRLI